MASAVENEIMCLSLSPEMSLAVPPDGRKERFASPYTEICPRQIYGVDTNTRLYQLGSLSRPNLLRGMVPNSVVCFDDQGREWFSEFSYPDLYLTRNGQKVLFGHAEERESVWFLTDFDAEAVDFTEAAWVVPVGAWGSDIDLMKIVWSRDLPTAINDTPDNLLGKSLRQQSFMIGELFADGSPVYWGVNNSAGTLHGRGLMSVLYPHVHVWKFSSRLDDLDAEKIKSVRKSVIWDEELSARFGYEVAKEFGEQNLYGYWNCASLELDNMGLTINLPGFTPDRLADFGFMRHFWEPLSLKIDDKLKAFHRRHFTSELEEIYEFVRIAHRLGEADEKVFAGFFHQREGSFDTEEGYLLGKLRDDKLLRYPPGWAGSIQFSREGALVAVTFGFLDVPMGPVEGNGVKLVRPEFGLSPEETRYKTERADRIVKASILSV